MSRNGSGTMLINSAGQPVVAGTTITATAFNALTADLAVALTQSICVDGQTTTTGLIPFAAGFKSDILSPFTANGPVSLTAGQVKFPSTQNPSSDANTLDDYEENSWTPLLTVSGGGTATYSNQGGFYIKVGRLVFATFDITLSGTGTLAGALSVGGLPFTVNNSANSRATNILSFSNLTTATTNVFAVAVENTTTAALRTAAGAVTTVQNLAAADLTNTTEFSGSIVYQATA